MVKIFDSGTLIFSIKSPTLYSIDAKLKLIFANMTDVDREDENQLDERPKSKKQETEDLERVTDYAEEKEIGSIDLNDLQAINAIEAQRSKENQAREEELAKVKITKEDVELIVKEFEITKQQAETALRQSNGDIVQALVRLLAQ